MMARALLAGMNMKRLLGFAVAMALFSACTPPPAPSAPSIQLYAMECGRGTMTDADVFSDEDVFKGQPAELIVPCYLIRHPNGDLIWDTGLPDALHDQPNGVDSGPFHMSMPTRLVDQLAQLQLTPADIEFLSVSHSHGDHVGNAGLFSAATWIVDADERAFMFRDEARTSEDFAAYASLENAETRLIEGDGDYDVFGDGSVTIIQAPGHTPGHTILRVNLANAGPILLTGDLWHLPQSRERRTVPRFNTDRAQTLASYDKAEALAAATGARVVRQHVIADFEALPRFPEALN